jgi:hypothetical protein
MDLVSFVKSKFGASIGVQLGRMLTPHQAYGLGDWIVQRIASKHDLEIVQGIRSNQAVIRGIPFEDKRLDAAIVEVLQNAAHGYADWFRLMAAGPEALLDSIEVDDGIYKSLDCERGR